MIKISAARNKQKEITDKLLSARLKRVRDELCGVDFCLSDENCLFEINPNICCKSNFVGVQVKARPCVGLYNDIDFIVTLFLQDYDTLKPPKIYNDRRIFHPNIDPFTCEIAVPQIIYWNPTYTLTYLLRRIKYTLIEPNNMCIPNNQICRKAAFFYKLDRQNYRTYVIQYCPTVLDQLAQRDINNLKDVEMEEEQLTEKKYVQITEILPVSRLQKGGKNAVKGTMERKGQEDKEDQQFQFLNKRLSQMRIYEDQDQQKREQTCFQFDSQYQLMPAQ